MKNLGEMHIDSNYMPHSATIMGNSEGQISLKNYLELDISNLPRRNEDETCTLIASFGKNTVYKLFQIEEESDVTSTMYHNRRSENEQYPSGGAKKLVLNDGHQLFLAIDVYGSPQLKKIIKGCKVLIEYPCKYILGCIILTDEKFVFLGGGHIKSDLMEQCQSFSNPEINRDTIANEDHEKISLGKNNISDLNWSRSSVQVASLCNSTSSTRYQHGEITIGQTYNTPVRSEMEYHSIPLQEVISRPVNFGMQFVINARLSSLVPPLKIYGAKFILRGELRNDNISSVCYFSSTFIESNICATPKEYELKSYAEKQKHLLTLSKKILQVSRRFTSFLVHYIEKRGIEIVSGH